MIYKYRNKMMSPLIIPKIGVIEAGGTIEVEEQLNNVNLEEIKEEKKVEEKKKEDKK